MLWEEPLHFLYMLYFTAKSALYKQKGSGKPLGKYQALNSLWIQLNIKVFRLLGRVESN